MKVMEHAAKPKGICCICGADAGASAIVGHVLCGGTEALSSLPSRTVVVAVGDG